jgi:DNA-binding PadR family transcriptional regulator
MRHEHRERRGGRDERRAPRHERHRERGRHRGWWRRRVFDHGELRLVMLHLIAARPRHGYDIIKAIEERLGGAYAPSPGVVYPTLTLLEEQGHLRALPSEDGKKQFAITPVGEAHLAENRAAVDRALARMDEAGAALGPAPQIVRAMENLKLALRMRMARGPLSDDQASAVAAAIDAAATAVERT